MEAEMRKFLGLLALALLIIAPAMGASAQGKTKITIVAGDWWFSEEGLSTVGGSEMGAADLIEYQKLHPDIEFDVRGVPFAELDSTQLAAMEANQGPDIMIVNSVTIGSFVDRGYIMPMTDLITAAKLDTSIFYPGLLGSAKIGDDLYGLPIDTGTRLLYYNKALFSAAGVEPPKTWAELPDVAKKVSDTANGVYGLVATSGERWVWLYEHAGMYALANGYKFVNDAATECVLNQGENPQAIQYWVDLYNAGVMNKDDLLVGTGAEREQKFGTNKAAMELGGHWAADVLAADYKMTYPDDFGTVVLEGKAGIGSSTGGWIFTISRDSKNPQAAMDFITWILSDGERLAHFTNIMPSTEAATAKTLEGDFYAPFKELLSSPNTRHPIPLNPGLPEQAEVLRNVSQSAILGEMTAQEAADSFCQQIEGTLFPAS
jgi:ABC-type glycerol-3-phosphate transport system substrate-binding protein